MEPEFISPDREGVNQFAQTRQPDDLFDDDFTPIPDAFTQPTPPRAHHPRSSQSRHHNGHSFRGRGRGQPTKTTSDRPPPSSSQQSAPPDQPQQSDDTSTTQDPTAVPSPSEKPQKPNTPATRGNRLGTGGIQKPKLTEDELSARLEAAKLNNARREEAHRLAEADEASFQQREAKAREKRREEGAARRAMEGEREKNRLRKLGARGGREWDEGKEEEVAGRRSDFRKGVNGGIGDVGKRTDTGEGFQIRGNGEGADESGYRGSTRGGYGGGRRGRGRGRGGRGRGRGDHGGGSAGGRGSNTYAPTIETRNGTADLKEADFPALATAPPMEKISTLQNKDFLKSPTGEKGTWADQVEAVAPRAGAGVGAGTVAVGGWDAEAQAQVQGEGWQEEGKSEDRAIKW